LFNLISKTHETNPRYYFLLFRPVCGTRTHSSTESFQISLFRWVMSLLEMELEVRWRHYLIYRLQVSYLSAIPTRTSTHCAKNYTSVCIHQHTHTLRSNTLCSTV